MPNAVRTGVTAALALLMATAPRSAAASTGQVPHPAGASSASTYNDGTAAYRKKDFAAARDRFQDATHTTDMSMQEDAYYDLGNARYRLGQASLPKDRPGTMEAWKSAVASYDGALALRPQDADARFNRDLVARRLAALEDQDRQDKEQQNQKHQKDQKDQKQGPGKQPQSSSGQGQKDQGSPQNGKGQPQQGQGSPQGTDGTKPSAARGGKGQPQATGQDQGQEQKPGQGPPQSPEEGGQKSAPAGQKQAENGQPQKDRPNQGSGGQPSAQHEKNGGAPQGPGIQADQEQKTPPMGPGVVSGQPGQSAGKDQSAVARRDPGALTPSEAVQLLDSVSGELHRLPVADARRRQSTNSDGSPIKDW